jgi:hypothetical protein
MTSRDQNSGEDKPAADLLRQTLASAASKVEACPDPEILAAYADRALDADETAHYEFHFSQCAHCREQLAVMVRASAPAEPPARRFHGAWPWTWFVFAPAAAALLFAALFIGRPRLNRVPEQHPLVAMQPTNQPGIDTEIFKFGPAASAPASPEPKVRESAAAKAAIPPNPPRVRSEAGSMQRSAADFTDDVKSGNGQIIAAPAPELEQKQSPRASNPPPPNSNEFSRLELMPKNSVKSKAAAAAPASNSTVTADGAGIRPAMQTPGGGVQYGDTQRARSQSQSVTVESAAPPVAAASAPQTLTNANAADRVSGVSGGAPAPAATKKEQPALVAGVANNALASSEMAIAEAPLDRGARTVVRSPDPEILWRISSGRFVERSSDAGATWRVQWTNMNAHLVAGSAPSVDTCWLVGRGEIVLLTTDGKKWRAIEPPANADFVAVDASNADSATVTSADGRKFQTSDAGKHWTPSP